MSCWRRWGRCPSTSVPLGTVVQPASRPAPYGCMRWAESKKTRIDWNGLQEFLPQKWFQKNSSIFRRTGLKLKVPPDVFKATDRGSKWCFRFMFCTFTFDRRLRFWSGLLVLEFTAAVGVFTWTYSNWTRPIDKASNSDLNLELQASRVPKLLKNNHVFTNF